jgi:hypothetical protein
VVKMGWVILRGNQCGLREHECGYLRREVYGDECDAVAKSHGPGQALWTGVGG